MIKLFRVGKIDIEKGVIVWRPAPQMIRPDQLVQTRPSLKSGCALEAPQLQMLS